MRRVQKNDPKRGRYAITVSCLLFCVGWFFAGCEPTSLLDSSDSESEWIQLNPDESFLEDLLPGFVESEEEFEETYEDLELLEPEDLQEDITEQQFAYNPYGNYDDRSGSYYNYDDRYNRGGRYNRTDRYGRGYNRYNDSGRYGSGGYCQDWYSFSGEPPRSPWRGVSVYGRQDRTACPGFNTPLNISVCADGPGEFLPPPREVEGWVDSWAKRVALIDSRGNYCNRARIVGPTSRYNRDCVTVGVAWGCDQGRYSTGGDDRYGRRYDGYYGGY